MLLVLSAFRKFSRQEFFFLFQSLHAEPASGFQCRLRVSASPRETLI